MLELTLVESFVAIEVHASEDNLKGANADATLLLDCQLELEVEFPHHHILVYAVERHQYFTKILILMINTILLLDLSNV